MSQERIDFLEQQLSAAVAHLRAKDATEEACTSRLNAIAKQAAVEADEKNKRLRSRLKVIETELSASANRYSIIRENQVQVWKLGIAATGAQLDELLDRIIETRNEREKS